MAAADAAMILYHGTRRPFGKRGLLLPRSEHDGPGTNAPLNTGRTAWPDADTWCYATEHVELAWAYAYAAPGRGRPRVLIVSPLDEYIHRDPESSEESLCWRFKSAWVVEVLTDPPFSQEAAEAGWAVR